jgi:hypothetical protein
METLRVSSLACGANEQKALYLAHIIPPPRSRGTHMLHPNATQVAMEAGVQAMWSQKLVPPSLKTVPPSLTAPPSEDPHWP